MSVDVTPPAAVSPALLRYLVSAHGLGPGARVAVCGGDAAGLVGPLEGLGLEVDSEPSRADRPLDAVVWIDTHGTTADGDGTVCGELQSRLRDGGVVISVVTRDAGEPAVTAGAPARTVPPKFGLSGLFGRGGDYVVRTLKPVAPAAFEEADVIPFDARTRTRIPARRAA